MTKLHVVILTIFPEMFPGPLQYSLAGAALKNQIWSYEVINIRDFGITKHKNVDDKAYGGGSGLIMRPDVVGNALDCIKKYYPDAPIYYPSPRGRLLKQEDMLGFLAVQTIIILCGRFEGVDERIIDEYNITEVSIGDYILSGGEIAALTILDCSIRLIPGVVVNRESLELESFKKDGVAILLEAPLYTRPQIWKNRKVPEVLLSGHHENIESWRKEQSIKITSVRRPELIKCQSFQNKIDKYGDC